MPARASISLHWLTLAVLVPLLLLAGLAVSGMRSQLKAAWTEARDLAPAILAEQRLYVARELNAAVVDAPVYPDPPVPGETSEKDAILDGTDISALLRLREDWDAGLSPAGLPRRVLAALRIHQLSPAAQKHEDLTKLFTRVAPSILTATALRKIDAPPDVISEWATSEIARQAARARPEEAAAGFGTASLWIQQKDGRIRYLPTSFVPETAGLPAWARLTLGGTAAGPVLATTAVPFGNDFHLTLSADPVILEKSIRRQQRWTFTLLGMAVLVSAIALVAIHRVVSRERKLSELKSQFVSSVSHELRAPLASIRLMAEALEQGKVAHPGQFHTLIAREGARLSHLIENVLDFARIEDGRKRYRFDECDLTALARDVVSLMKPLADDRGAAIRADFPEITATLDPAAIQQALVNLIDNAIKFSPPGGTIHLALEEAGESWRFTVRDHGPGIPASEQQRIFERFHRLGNELRRETQGTGIGLSIVRHIAAAHGGTITCTSTPPDGAAFTLQIPHAPCDS